MNLKIIYTVTLKVFGFYLILVFTIISNLASAQATPKDSCNISTESKAIAFAKKQFQKAYGQIETGKLYAKLLNNSTWFVTSNPTPIELDKKNNTIHFGGVSLKFDKATCRVLEIHRWK